MHSKSGDSSELGDGETSPEAVISAPTLLVSIEINELGIEEEADDDTPPKLEISPKKEAASSPEENKNPDRDKSSSFTPPPALSPAHPKVKGEEQMEVDEDKVEEEEKKPVKTSDVGKGSPLVKVEKMEKKTYNKKKNKSKDSALAQDPNAPKRNRSAYVHFIISRRSAYSKATMSQSNININLAADWQKLNAEDRKPFHKLAEEEKAKYIELMEEYKKTDSHKEFQKKRAQLQNGRKRKNEDSDEDETEKKQMNFPNVSAFCPLLNEPTASTSGSLQYAGPIFTPEFVAYNKTRDSYRRQLATERSKLEHELEALHMHEEVKLEKQKQRIREKEEKIDETLKTMRTVLGSIPEAKDHLTDIDTLSTWLQSIGKRPALRKRIHEALMKSAKK